MNGYRRVVAGMVVLTACGALAWAQSGQAPTRSAELPKAAREVVDHAWKNWRLVEVNAAGNAACVQGLNGQSPSLVSGDFNGDGRADYALQIVTSKGIQLIALIQRLDGFDLHDIATLSATPPSVLRVEPRGTTYHTAASFLTRYFGNDTVSVTACGGDQTAYFWTGSGFTPTVILPPKTAG
jgi:hypothetical protein